jgi:hypothetical protein
LLAEIDQQRARDAADTGSVQFRSEWFREAARGKLGIDYTEEPTNESGADESKGAA